MKLSQPIVHGECGKQWTGALRAHCPACHRTFNRDSGANTHRVGAFGVDRRCADPATLGFTEKSGIWYAPSKEGSPWSA